MGKVTIHDTILAATGKVDRALWLCSMEVRYAKADTEESSLPVDVAMNQIELQSARMEALKCAQYALENACRLGDRIDDLFGRNENEEE